MLFVVMLAMAFTGHLLPWDQKAYFATAVSTNIFVLPVVGPWIKAFVRGGNELGTLAISRFFVAHVVILPAAIFAFVAMHVYLCRRAGAAGAPVRRRAATESFYPRQLILHIAFASVLVLALGALAH